MSLVLQLSITIPCEIENINTECLLQSQKSGMGKNDFNV